MKPYHFIKISASTSFLSLVLLLFSGCQRKGCMDEFAENYDAKAKKEGDCVYNDFDRAAFLRNYNGNITAKYATFNYNMGVLNDVFQDFKTNPNDSSLTYLKDIFKSHYINWQGLSSFEFGIADNISWKLSTNTFPTDIQKIENNISEGQFNLEGANQITASGLPALDYLFNNNTNDSILNQMTNQNRVEYTQSIINKLLQESLLVLEDYIDSYDKTFTSSLGTDAGSSLSLLVNNFNKDLELLKNAQLGIPMGKKTLGVAMPEQTQGYHGKMSRDLMLDHLRQLEKIFHGFENLGLDDYLDFVGAKYENENLSQVIINQFQICENLILASNTPISEAVSSEADQLNLLYTEVQKLVVLTKTDMPSALGVLITYQDNDGD